MKKLLSLILLLSFNIKAQDVTIGTQTWTSKNLDVTTYRNGDTIPEVQDKKAWAKLTTGAWCYYENKTENGTTYGKLYNLYAVYDERNLAPEGYHIPLIEDWKMLSDYLGKERVASKKIKSTSGWKTYDANEENRYEEIPDVKKRIETDGNGTNTTGFTGLPGGCREGSSFSGIGDQANWWGGMYLQSDHKFSSIYIEDRKAARYGLSVRLIKD